MSRKRNLLGQRFGSLVVIKDLGYYKANDKHFWSLVRCDCGKEFPIQDTYLVNSRQTKCAECSRKVNAKHLMTNARIYHVYQSMKGRCYNPNNIDYKNYGGRGIKVCDEWLNNSTSFIEWAYKTGYDESAKYGTCTLDRIDVNGDYCPENCRWADSITQARNKKDTIFMNYKGEKIPVQKVAELTGIKASTLVYRIKHGYSDEDAVLLPVGGEDVLSHSKNHELKRNVLLVDKVSNRSQEFGSCSLASKFLGHNVGYLSNMMRKLGTNHFEVEDYYVEIGELSH